MTNVVPVVITAGGRISGELAAAAGTTIKALVPMGGRLLIERVLDALRSSERTSGKIRIVGPEAEMTAALSVSAADDFATGTVSVMEEGRTGPENMLRGLSDLVDAGDRWALLCTCDLPFLTSEALCWLLDNAPEDADIIFPIITKQEYEAAFPGSPGTYVGIEGSQYTGGSVFLVRPSAITRNLPLIERVFEARKGVLSLARLGGLGLCWRLLLGVLTVEYVEARASQLTGCRCRAVRHAPPSLAADVDTMDDYRFACQRLMTPGASA